MDRKQLSARTRKQIEGILKVIRENHYLFLLGPRGSGKTRLIKAAIPEIEKELGFACRYIDLEEYAPKGAYFLYNHILKIISSGRRENLESSMLSDDFISEIESAASGSKHKIVLIFDGFRAVNSEFYDNFAIDCRKIHSQAQAEPDSGLGNILMVFAGSLIGYAQNETSPLWNITEHIPLLDPDEKETSAIIKPLFDNKNIPPAKELIRSIFELTKGNVSLARALTQFIIQKKRPQRYQNRKDQLLEDFILYIWRVTNTKKQKRQKKLDQKLHRHFVSVVEYLETIPDVLEKVLDLLDGKPVPASWSSRSVDPMVITGAIRRNDNGCYDFTNPIYQKFLEKLLSCHRKGDFCLFHVQEEGMWERAKAVYEDLHRQGLKRDMNEPVSPRSNHFSYISSRLVNQLRIYDTSAEFLQRFKEYLTYVFDVGIWRIYHVDHQKEALGRPDHLFDIEDIESRIEYKTGFQISGSFYKRVLDSKTPNFDYTGRWFAVPFMIREDFERIFVSWIDISQKNLTGPLSDFVLNSLAVFYRIQTREKSRKDTERLRNILFHPRVSQREDLNRLWSASKDVVSVFSIHSFVLHEIIENDTVVLTTGSENQNLAAFTERKPIDNDSDLKKVVKMMRKGFRMYSERNAHYIGKSMSSGNLMLIQIEMPSEEYNKIKHSLEKLMHFVFTAAEIGVKLNDAEKRFPVLQRTLKDSEDFVYVIDNNKKILFINEKLKNFIVREMEINLNEFEGVQCTDIFPNQSCATCPANRLFSPQGGGVGNNMFKMVREFILSGRHVFETTYVPITGDGDDQIIAVAVYMYDVTERDFLLECLSDMAKLKDIRQIDRLIFEALEHFGFQRVFRWRPDPENKQFISDDFKGSVKDPDKGENFRKGFKSFHIEDQDLLKERVIVWSRKNNQRRIKVLLEERFKRSETQSESNNLFKIKESKSWPAYDPENIRPDFWVTIPIFGRGGIRRLFVVDNWGNDDLDQELINLDKLQMLETFAGTASQIRENARKSSHLNQISSILSHSAKERLTIIRSLIKRTAKSDSLKIRKQISETADANIKMLQTVFHGILSSEPRPDYFESKRTDLSSLMRELFQTYQAYSGRVAHIQFDLNISREQMEAKINTELLQHIMNNLVGNAIHHLTEIEQEEKKIWINLANDEENIFIDIVDNGNGMPGEYRKDFENPFRPDDAYQMKGFGIVHSRRMAYWMGANLDLINGDDTTAGTTFRLTFNT